MTEPIKSKEEYIELYNRYPSLTAIAEQLGVSRHKVTSDFHELGIEYDSSSNTSDYRRRHGITRPSDDEEVEIGIKQRGKKSPACGYDASMLKLVQHRVYDEKSREELFDSVIAYQDAHNGQSNICRLVEANYNSDYLLVVNLADIHIGGESTLMRLLKHHLNEMVKRKNLVLLLCGDYTDNFITFAQNDQLIKPEDQLPLFELVIDAIKDRTIACVRGNHDERNKKVVDIDMVAETCKKANIPYLGAEGWVKLTVGNIEYTIFVAHQGRYNSAMNPTHAVKQAFNNKGEFDVGVISHNHNGDIEQDTKWGKQRICIRPGTYKVFDRYAINKGYNGVNTEDEYQVCVPCVLFFGKEKKMIPFYKLEDGLLMLDLLEGVNK